MSDFSSPEMVLNCIMAIKRGCTYQELLNAGFTSEFVLSAHRIIAYVETCMKYPRGLSK